MEIKKIIQKNPLYFAFLFPALVDGVTTLLGQSSSYWNGAEIVSEASPAYYFLLASPWAFIAGSIVWFFSWYWLFKKLKEPLKLWLMFVFIAGHAWGSGGWLAKIIKNSGWMTSQLRIIETWGVLIIYFSLIGLFAAYCLRFYFHHLAKITRKD